MLIKAHHLKIFISSTFKDMQDERQKLITDVFIKFRKLAKQRGVEVTEIELRTGVTDATGHIAKVCLEQVDRCINSPIFFIGILGDYYGWDKWYEAEEKKHLKESHKKIIEKYPNISITELEIRYAIENPNHNQAFFYVTKPIETEDKRLIALKDELKQYAKERNNLIFDYYETDKDFAQKVYQDLEKEFYRLYPKEQQESELDKLRASHQAFALSRYKGYIHYDENEKILDEFLSVENQEDRLLLYGESGLGKSALIANYFKNLKSQKNDYFIIEHYIGGAGELSSDFYAMLRHIILEIKDEFNLEDEVLTEPEKILNDFTLWLQKVKRKTVIVLDGYNQIEDEVKERFLKSYLSVTYQNIKLIVTSIDSDYAINNKKQIQKLNRKKQKELVVKYLDIYGKRLTYDIDELLKHKMTDNTLFLRTLLEEIRLLGVFETIGEDISEYLKSKDVKELFIKIFHRYERDYDKLLIKEVLFLLYVSRDGLSETNLIEIMEEKRKISRYKFYPMLLALEEHLINSNGLYKFFHDYIKEAVYSKYLYTTKLQNSYKEKIINYFENRDIDNQRVRELPFQLFEIRDRERLYDSLIDVEFFVAVQEMDEYELLRYVRFVDEEFDISEKLMNLLLKDTYLSSYTINEIANFFHTTYVKYDKSLLLYDKSLEINKNFFGLNHIKTAISYNNLAGINKARGEYNLALKFYYKSLKINSKNRELNELHIAQNYSNLAEVYRIKGEYKLSLKLYKRALELREKKLSSVHYKTAIIYHNIAFIHRITGKFDKALFLYKKALQIYEMTLGKKSSIVAIGYNNLGGLYRAIKNYEFALLYCIKALKIREELFGINHPATAQSIANLAEIYRERGDRDNVLPLTLKALDIREKALGKNHLDTAVSYNNLALIYTLNKDYKKASTLYKKIINIHENILGKNHLDTARSYNNFGAYYYFIKDYKNAYKYVNMALKIKEKIMSKNHPDLVGIRKNLKEIEKFL